MAESASSAFRRHLSDAEDDADRPTKQRKVRFPKGRKHAKEDEFFLEPEHEDEEILNSVALAAKERANRRRNLAEELVIGSSNAFQHISAAEVNYETRGTFEDDGVLMEPFNLVQERKEGYFDAEGNFVEYVGEREVKDAWIDSVDVDTTFAERKVEQINRDEEARELSSEDIAKIKRRIVDLLHPGETILQALRRLKGTSGGKKEKMSEHMKHVFDQLTDDSMKLLENGDYNVYHSQREVFERETEGYANLSGPKRGTGLGSENGTSDMFHNEPISRVALSPGQGFLSDPSVLAASPRPASSGGGDLYDMFGEDDTEPSSIQPETEAANGGLQADFVFDETTGYYYSSSFGFYYDPVSGFYCSATTGKWYSYNEQTAMYDELSENAVSGAC